MTQNKIVIISIYHSTEIPVIRSRSLSSPARHMTQNSHFIYLDNSDAEPVVEFSGYDSGFLAVDSDLIFPKSPFQVVQKLLWRMKFNQDALWQQENQEALRCRMVVAGHEVI